MTLPRQSSWLLLAGILAGFLGASWQGRLASGYSKPDGFRRFHQRISPDALYYPPYAMLEALALARWHPGQTLVIIGGNSIFNGVGQPVDDLWSVQLQELLGARYVVVNLAFRGAYPAQGAALVAESLLLRGYPVIYVANTNPPAATGRAVGGASGYLYWQALYQHRLSGYAPRETEIRNWLQTLPPKEREQQAEERLGSWLEAWTRHQSLWHHIGYRHVFTVWNFVVAQDPWGARDHLPDNEPQARPLGERFKNLLPEEMAIVRGYSANMAVQDAHQQWHLEGGNRQRLVDDIEKTIIPSLRPHTLIILNKNCPYYLNLLTASERARDTAVYADSAQIWRDHGIACAVSGEDYESIDYIDRAHLSSDGGRKVARLVAQQIRQLHQP